jgi:DNA-binding NtrC family response regulator
VAGFEPAALEALKAYPWPGNIRELENVIERLVIVKGQGTIGVADIPGAIRAPRPTAAKESTPLPALPEDGTDLRAMLEAVEDRMIGEALERTGGNKNRAAELLGLNRTTLVEKLRRKRVA